MIMMMMMMMMSAPPQISHFGVLTYPQSFTIAANHDHDHDGHEDDDDDDHDDHDDDDDDLRSATSGYWQILRVLLLLPTAQNRPPG